MRTGGICARYSTDDRAPTSSIEDQVRQCRDAADQRGFTVEDKRVFADRAISGDNKGSEKRAAFWNLLDAIGARGWVCSSSTKCPELREISMTAPS